jgi:hypothetical protein
MAWAVPSGASARTTSRRSDFRCVPGVARVTDSPAPAASATAGWASTASLFSSAVMAISVLSLVPLVHAEAGTTGVLTSLGAIANTAPEPP